MNELRTQQLLLHFGDDYPSVVAQATRYCNTLINKPWWGPNRKVLLTNEGGVAGMRLNSLMYVIELEDIRLGLHAYGQYLRSEYGSDKLLTLEYSSVPEEDPNPLGGEGSLAGVHPLDGLLHVLRGLSALEEDFWATYASIKDVKETSSLLGISEKDGYRIWRRVKGRASRAVKS